MRWGEASAAGADLLNDSWGGWDARLAEVAAEFGADVVCSHAGGLPVRSGDLAALIRMDPALAPDLMVTGRPAWQVLAEP